MMPNPRSLLVAAFLALLPVLSLAQDGIGEARRAAVEGTIRSQMDAFLRDDGVAAFSHAAPMIREKFQSPEVFMAMVRSGYAPVYRPREVEFLEPREEAGDILQPVRVTGPAGESVIALYRMQLQADGVWRIAGVVLIRTGERSS